MAIAICQDEAAVDSAWKASGAVTDESTISEWGCRARWQDRENEEINGQLAAHGSCLNLQLHVPPVILPVLYRLRVHLPRIRGGLINRI